MNDRHKDKSAVDLIVSYGKTVGEDQPDKECKRHVLSGVHVARGK